MSDHIPHPGRYNGRRNDFQKLSEYWAQRSRYYEGENGRLFEALVETLQKLWGTDETDAREIATRLSKGEK